MSLHCLIMGVACEFGGKSFAYNCQLGKHLSRKFPCFPQHAEPHFECTKCARTYVDKRDYTRHTSNCKGLHTLQCPTCKKEFSTYTTKSRHLKNARCKPVTESNDTLREELERLRTENERLKMNTINITQNITLVNWSDEKYTHMTPHMIADIIRRCSDAPIMFFSEFPRVAHQGAHKNICLPNIRGNYVDVVENGRVIKIMVDTILEDCTKRMLYRVEDAYGEDTNAFEKVEGVTESLVRMEDVVHGVSKKDASDAQLRAMKQLQIDSRQAILGHVRSGLWTKIMT